MHFKERSWTAVKYHCNYWSQALSSEDDARSQREHPEKAKKNGEAFLEKMTNRMISYAVLAVTQCPCRESFFRAVSNRMTSRRRTAHIFTDWDWASDGTTLAMNNMTCDVFFFISQAPFDCIHLSAQSSSLFMMGGTTGAAFQSRAFAAKVSTWRTYYSVLCLCFIPK